MQYQPKNISKIYSRTRMNFSFFKNNPKRQKKVLKIKKVSPIFFCLVIAITVCVIIWSSINPIFEKLCEDEAKSIATKITNEETTKIMNNYNYDTFFTIEKDENGDVQMITANVLKINQVTSDIAKNIQISLENKDTSQISISAGALTGINFLSGYGPKINMHISPTGNIETNIRSEFISQGVNQTIHRIYLDVETHISILTPSNIKDYSIENQIIILENVILGKIPSTYYNFEGITNENQVLDMTN